MTDSILDRWDLTAAELTDVIDSNPSLRGFLFGYVSEFKLRKLLFSDDKTSNVRKFDDHDRTKTGDLSLTYKGYDFTVEVKSLQTLSARQIGEAYIGNFQCDASDSRIVSLANGERVKTTCLIVDGFDLVAVNLFAFRHQWDFAFALNRDLPRSTHRGYTLEQRQYLLATSVRVGWPLEAPFVSDPFILLDRLVNERSLLNPP